MPQTLSSPLPSRSKICARESNPRALLGEVLPETVAVQTAELVPLDELGPARRLLGADGAAPFRIEQVLPGLGCLRLGHAIRVVGDPDEHDARMEEVARRVVERRFRVGLRLRR